MALALLTRSLVQYQWSAAARIGWLAGLAVGGLLFWTVLDLLAKRSTGAAWPLALGVVAVGSSVVLLYAGSLKLAQLAGALAACLGVATLIGWWRPLLSLARGAVPVVAVLLSGLWLAGYFYAEALASSVGLLALAPLAVCFTATEAWQRLPNWLRNLLFLAALLVPVALAVTLAIRAAPAEELVAPAGEPDF